MSNRDIMATSTMTLPAHWASYLINGDDSGLDEGEREHIDEYMYRQGVASVVDVADDARFSHAYDCYGGLANGGDVATYTVEFAE